MTIHRWIPKRMWQSYRSGDDIVTEFWWAWNWTTYRVRRFIDAGGATPANAPTP